MREEDEIAKELDKCMPLTTPNCGMTYDDIVRDTLEWVLGITDSKPIPDDD